MKNELHKNSDAISWMVNNPVASNLLMLLLIIGGVVVFLNTTQEVFPPFERDVVNISVSYPGSSPEEVERSIVLPIENAVYEVEGIGEIASTASEGSARISVEVLDPDERMKVAQDLKDVVDRITSFPDDAEEPRVSLDNRKRSVLRVVLFGDTSEKVLREAAESIKDRFNQNSEIGPVDLRGARDHEIQIEISQDTLRRYGISLDSVSTIIKKAAIEVPGGTIETEGGDLLIRVTERKETYREFLEIPILTSKSGAIVKLGDIANITFGFEDSNKYALLNGKKAIVLEVNRVGEQTPISVADAVKSEIVDINKSLPGDISLQILNDRSKVFEQRATLLIKNGALGLILVVIFLGLFLDIRVAFWVAMGIPISFGGAFLLFPATDFSINIVSMFAFIVSLGIVVDDAIVVGENIFSHREMGKSPIQAAVEGAKEVGWPIVFSVVTNIVAFVPLYFIPGIMGKIFKIIPVVVICVFSVSLIECLFILPAHLRLKNKSGISSKGMVFRVSQYQKKFNLGFEKFVDTHYRTFLTRVVNNRYGALIIAIAILTVAYSYALSGKMGMVPFPRVESDYAYGQVVLPLGVNEKEVDRIVKQIYAAAQRTVAQYPKGKISEGIFFEVSDNSVEARIYLPPPDIRAASTREVTQKWRKEVGELIGIESSSFISNRGGPGSGAVMTIELSHRDNDTLIKAANSLAASIDQLPKTSNIDDGTADGKRQFDFKVNSYGKSLGLTAKDIASQIRSSFYGIEALKQQIGVNEVTVRVSLPEEERKSELALKDLIIKTPSSKNVLLRDVVSIKEGKAYTSISRRNGRRTIQVTADVEPRKDADKVLDQLKRTALLDLEHKYDGLGYSFEGRQAEMRESISSLKVGLICVLLIIFALIAVLFRSYTQPLMVMFAIPFSAIGALVGHLIMGYTMSLMSLFGLMALTGVVVNDSIVLIEFANRTSISKEKIFESIIESSIRRFRPIMLTTMTTFVGLAPMMFETSRQAKFLIPMAISLGFGILFATFITLVLIPALYLIIEDIKGFFLD